MTNICIELKSYKAPTNTHTNSLNRDFLRCKAAPEHRCHIDLTLKLSLEPGEIVEANE